MSLRLDAAQGRVRTSPSAVAPAYAVVETAPRFAWFWPTVEQGRLTAFFQPVVCLKQNTTIGFEALARAHDGDCLRSGYELTRAAAELGASDWFDRACMQVALHGAAAQFHAGELLFLNVNPMSVVRDLNALADLATTVRHLGLPLDTVVIELVETGDRPTLDQLGNLASAVREHGFRLALDDFGTGAWSAEELTAIRPDIVKFDRDVATWSLDRVQPMVSEAQAAGCLTVLEGVEHEDHLTMARAAGFDMAQGYGIGRPEANCLRNATLS